MKKIELTTYESYSQNCNLWRTKKLHYIVLDRLILFLSKIVPLNSSGNLLLNNIVTLPTFFLNMLTDLGKRSMLNSCAHLESPFLHVNNCTSSLYRAGDYTSAIFCVP